MHLESATDRAGIAEEQAALRRIAMLVAEQPSPQEIFTAVTEAVGPLLGADMAAMHVFPGNGTATTIAGWSATSEMLPVGTRLSLDGDSVATRIFQTGAAARIDGYVGVAGEAAEVARGLRLRSTVGAPILVRGKLWGALMAATRGDEPFPDDAEDRIAAFTELVATAIANAEARRELESVVAEQQALRRAATLVASGASPAEVFAAITTSAADVFGVPFASLIRVGPDETATMVAGCAGCSEYVGISWRVPVADPGITRRVLDSRRPSHVDDHRSVSGPIGEAARALGVGPVVGAPVVVDGDVWGLLVVGALQGDTLPSNAGDRLVGFTELLTTTLINAETRDDVRRLAEGQASLRRIATIVAEGATPDELFFAVAQEVSAVLGAPIVNVDRYELEDGQPISVVVGSLNDPDFPTGSRWPLDGPSARMSIYETGRPARIDDFRGLESTTADAARASGVRWVVGAPIVVDGSVWGNICAGTKGDEPIPDDAEARIADFTELVSTAIANSEAHEKVRRLLNEQAALRRVATLVAAEVDPAELFSAVTDEIAHLFGSEGAGIWRFEQDGSGFVALGVSGSLEGIPLGTRSDFDDLLPSTVVYRTGRTARRDAGGSDVRAAGPIGDTVRKLVVYSSVAAPIFVAGSLWGTVSTFAADTPLPPDTAERLEKFGALVATAIANTESRNDLADAEARARALAEEQAALRRVATLVAQGTSSGQLFAAVSNEVASLFSAEIATIGRFEPGDPAELTAVGVSQGEHDFLIGVRTPLLDWLASTTVHRTGRTARKEVRAEQITGEGTLPDAIRALGYFSTVSAPILVEGELWGVLTASSAHERLPADTEGRIESFSELVATAIANAQSRGELATSEARARALAEEQAALRRVATLAASTPVSEQFFSTVAREVAEVLNVPGVIVTRYERDGMAVVFGEDFHAELAGADAFFGVGSRAPSDPGSLAAQVFETHDTARIDDFGTLVGTVGDLARAAGFGCGCAAPIVVNGDLWGKMCVFSGRGVVLPVGTEDRLNDFIELVVTAISNYEARSDLAASEERARGLANEQAALRRVATLVAEGAEPREVFDAVRREVARAFDVKYNVLWRYEPDGYATVMATARGHLGPVGKRWRVDGDTSVTARIRATGRPARVDFTTEGHAPGSVAEGAQRESMHSGIGVPIIVDGELWGAMVVGSQTDGAFPAGLEDGLARFTELLATAIANAKSREEVARLAAEQAALRRVATLVAEGAEPARVFASVAEEAAGIIGLPLVFVSRYEADGSFTMLGIAGETEFTIGSRWLVEDDGIAGRILRTGRPARKDDYSDMPGPLGDAIRRERMIATVGLPIVVDGAIWGFMDAAATPGRPIPADAEERLARFTEIVATAVSNATTRTELLASRARVVSAADETRRRLERDLHDGIQQWLVALALKARKAGALSGVDATAKRELAELADDLVSVTDELREISRGIHPAILSDAGLDDALAALARRSSILVDLDVSFQRRFDPTIEATAYYVVAESITNAVKHAQASTLAVRGGLRDGSIELEIKDNGVGGADPRHGTGLIGLRDRVDTLGGTISLASPAGAGTTVRVWLPARLREGDAGAVEPVPAPLSG